MMYKTRYTVFYRLKFLILTRYWGLNTKPSFWNQFHSQSVIEENMRTSTFIRTSRNRNKPGPLEQNTNIFEFLCNYRLHKITTTFCKNNLIN